MRPETRRATTSSTARVGVLDALRAVLRRLPHGLRARRRHQRAVTPALIIDHTLSALDQVLTPSEVRTSHDIYET